MIHHRAQSVTELVVVFVVRLQIFTQVFYLFNYFFRLLFYRERFQSLQNGLQVGEEGSGGGDDDFVFSRCALD